MSVAATDPSYRRVTVLAPRTSVDAAVPADLPVAELVPMLLQLVSEPRPGTRPQPWRLFDAAGIPLSSGRSLADLGVFDGDLLRIAPDHPGPATPVFDDPVEAVAATAGPGWTDGQRFRSIAIVALAGAAGLLLLGVPAPASLLSGPTALLMAPEAGLAWIAAMAGISALAWAAWLTRRDLTIDARMANDADAGTPASEAQSTDTRGASGTGRAISVHRRCAAGAAALAAVPLAAVAGWAVLPAAAGPVRVLLTAIVAGGAAALGQVAVRRAVPALVAAAIVAATVGFAALAVLRLGVTPAAAAVAAGAIALVAGPLSARPALWLSGLPRPVVPTDTGELIDADTGPGLLPPAELAERARLARDYLAGSVGGCAVVACAGAFPAAADAGWTGPAFAALTVVLLGLRARSFADPGPAHALAVSALAAGIGLATLVGTSAVPWARPAAAVSLLIVAAALLGSTSQGRRPGSPVRRRAVDLAEGLLTAAVVPLALGVLDVYRLVRAN